MSKLSRKGFTIVEVVLFIALTAALLAGLLSGSIASIKRHRYADSVNDFTEFLRRTYSEVVYIENERTGTIGDSRTCSVTAGVLDSGGGLSGISDNKWQQWVKTNSSAGTTYDGFPGRSQCAIYGTLITFGEKDASGKAGKTIYTYDVIGRALEQHEDLNSNNETTGQFKDIKTALTAVNADILTVNVKKKNGKPTCRLTSAGNVGIYNLQWDAYAETPEGKLFKGSILIVRSPSSGTIHTLYTPQPINTNIVLSATGQGGQYNLNNSDGYCQTGQLTGYVNAKSDKAYLTPYIDPKNKTVANKYKFAVSEINICVASTDSAEMDNQRRNIRILANGRNATAVELIAADDRNNNKCIK